MKLSFKLQVNATREKVWSFYCDVHKWKEWEDDLEVIEIDGEFKTGSKGMMKLVDQPAMKIVLNSVTENVEFSDQTDIPGIGSLVFYHHLFEENGKVIIEHTVELANAPISMGNLMFLKQVFDDVPKTVFALKELAEK